MPVAKATGYAFQADATSSDNAAASATVAARLIAWSDRLTTSLLGESATTPPASPKMSRGDISAKPTKATSSAESVRSKTIQPKSVSCIHRDT